MKENQQMNDLTAAAMIAVTEMTAVRSGHNRLNTR